MLRRPTPWLALAVFLLACGIYFITLTPTVPFWDSGEFIAVSYILGIPHPPGTPFYVLLGRLATLVPIGNIAQRVNGLSALASALAALFSYLVILRLNRLVLAREAAHAPPADGGHIVPEDPRREWIAQAGALIGAAMLIFSDNFWENSIEAEVYSLASLAQIGALWLGLRWWEAHEQKPTSGPLLVAVYLMWLCVGLHLGVGMMAAPLFVLVWLVDRRAAIVFAIPLLTALCVTFGMEKMLGAVLAGFVLVTMVYAFQRKLSFGVWAVSAGACVVAMVPAFSDSAFTPTTGLLAIAGVVVPLAVMWRRVREARILGLALLLMVVGYSTHLYLPIRAAQHPAINEGDPSNWRSLRDLLERKQYGQTSMFVRRGTWESQLDKEFWRYWKRQWALTESPPLDQAGSLRAEPRWFQYLLPLFLGLAGLWWNRRDRVSFLTMLCLFLFSTAVMILFLNFSDREVRDRDYFFTTGYHVFSLWIGMGAAWMIRWVRDSFPEGPQRRAASVTAAVLLAMLPLMLARAMWFTHDRRGNYVARDYAFNMLAPLPPNAFLFTNGDNDTFPLWYIQEVEGVRKDVRVVNMSLLNTDWYIKQLRDQEPKVPIRFDDETIDRSLATGALQISSRRSAAMESLLVELAAEGAGMAEQGYVVDRDGQIIYTNVAMVRHIMSANRQGTGGWKKPPYYAVTVPEHAGLEPYFSLEGLVYRVNRDTLQDPVDEPATRKALYQTFRYRGLFNPDGSWDPTVYKDENASTLSRNYAAAHLQLAFWHRKRGEHDRSIAELERVSRMFPDYVEVAIPLGGAYMDRGDTTRALELFERLAKFSPGHPEVRYYYGVTLMAKGHLQPAIAEFDAAIRLDPNYNLPYYAAYLSLWEAGERERSLTYLQRWVDLHPDDAQAAALLGSRRGGGGQAPPAMPRLPNVPGLP